MGHRKRLSIFVINGDHLIRSTDENLFGDRRTTGGEFVDRGDGFDVVELSPDAKSKHATYLAAKLVYRMLGFVFAT